MERSFEADAPNRLRIADITHLRAWAGFVFLAVVLDIASRKVEVWSLKSRLRAELVVQALDRAIGQRAPAADKTRHSDQG